MERGAARRDSLRLLGVIAALDLFFLPSLGFGLLAGDDVELLTGSLAEPGSGVFGRFLAARPLWVLSYPLVDALGGGLLAQRVVSLALLDACVWAAWHLLGPQPLRPLVLLVTFLHPAFVYPVTWLAQRSDLLLIGLAAAMLLQLERRRGLLFAAASLLAKAPFVVHAALYAWWAGRGGALPRGFGRAAGAAALALAGAALAGVFAGYYTVARDAAEPIGLYQVTGHDPASLAFVAASRAAKVVEGVALALAPLPAFWGTGVFGVALVAYAVAWAALGACLWRDGAAPARHAGRALWLAGAMALPLAFGTGLRVVPPLVAFLYLGLLAPLRPSRPAIAALALLAATHLAGAVLEYRYSDTGCRDPRDPEVWRCAPRDVPSLRFQAERQARVDAFVRRWLGEG